MNAGFDISCCTKHKEDPPSVFLSARFPGTLYQASESTPHGRVQIGRQIVITSICLWNVPKYIGTLYATDLRTC